MKELWEIARHAKDLLRANCAHRHASDACAMDKTDAAKAATPAEDGGAKKPPDPPQTGSPAAASTPTSTAPASTSSGAAPPSSTPSPVATTVHIIAAPAPTAPRVRSVA